MWDKAVEKIQNALIVKGFLPGTVDGIWGRRTIAAVKAFQEREGLDVDGIVGPKTLAALFHSDSLAISLENPVLPWMVEAENLIGTREVLGDRDNPVILDWADSLDIRYPGDDVPWCGLFVAHCISSSLPEEILPPNPLGARQWEKFGNPVEPRLGTIMVFWRESLTSGKGHVGFYTGEDGSAYRILGGNQGDKVSFMWIAKDRFLKARWPQTAVSLGGGNAVVIMDRTEDLSSNEA